ncbi:MAG: hypothetical protein JWO90_1958 [Solirubrobacterales bacterium]|nr:hypothetical protein [Solirubrobacterales bacterium]
MSEPFVHALRVRYHECDAQGVVFNANWLAYCDVALTELWRARFGSYAALLAQGVDVVVADAALRFRRPGHFDDELELEVAVVRLAETELELRTRALRAGELLVEATLRYVAIDPATFKRTSLPASVRAGLEEHLVAAS